MNNPQEWYVPIKVRKCESKRNCWECFFYRFDGDMPVCTIDYNFDSIINEKLNCTVMSEMGGTHNRIEAINAKTAD